ncbi:MAG TPA: divergent polysaccharide deacetylase family protein [Gallibacterium anatis]|uniref:Divergent polysaccharide deacetylase family protein n=1 Tax=Gallibacterium anatis TaxID=750 RepID=A0A921L1V7_9PAST|nr:divergent polysaccharide deacetylase family protein [Gallibacterium anatis]
MKYCIKCLLALLMLFSLSPNAAQLAIVIDDIGYRQHEDNAIFALPLAVNVAIIPSAPYAQQRAKQAHQQGRDTLIHMPMQAKSNIKLEANGLVLGLTPSQVSYRIDLAKNIIPNAIGMNNHMGSAATSDSGLMHILMQQLAQRGLSFLDSKTIGNSVAVKIAKQYGVSALERNIFLDDNNEYDNIQRQFQRAIQYARKHQTAIVIGHPRKNTIAVLQQQLSHLPADIELIKISQLWQQSPQLLQPFNFWFSDIPAPTSKPPFYFQENLRGIPQ